MNDNSHSADSGLGNSIILIASIVIVFTGVKLASGIVVPFLLSMFITIILLVPVEELIRKGVPTWLSLLIVVAVMLLFFAGIFVIAGTAAAAFTADLPGYQQELQVLITNVSAWFDARGVAISGSGLKDALNPERIVTFLRKFLGDIGGALSSIMLIVLMVIFMLSEVGLIKRKLAWHLKAHSEAEDQFGGLSDLTILLSTYIKIKAAVSLLTGILIWLGLSLMGIKYPVLWGLLAFLLNFIPTVGSIIAAFPVLLLALLHLDPVLLMMIAALYLVVNIVVGNFIEPVWMGGEVGLTTLAVFISMIFWGWLFGPVGMFLSVPLTIAVKHLSLRNPHTLWLAALLSNTIEKTTVSTTTPSHDD
jgi:predicted PurR-regulated permease PerM